MVESAQVFSALAVLFLISSIPFPGKFKFTGEMSLFQKNTVVRGENRGAIPLSNGNSRRRIEVENDSFFFVSSQEPLMSPALSESEFQGIGEHSQEEEFRDTSGEIPSKKLPTRAPEAQPTGTVGAIFFSTQEDEDTGQPGHVCVRTSVAEAPQTSFQAIPRVGLEGASGREQPKLFSGGGGSNQVLI